MSNTSHPVTMNTFQKLATLLSPEVTLCVRGRHAVGKSEGVYQAASKLKHDFYKSETWEKIKNDPNNGLPHELKDHTYEMGIPVIERRLSQMSEGDIVGLPFMHKNQRTGANSTSFEPCDWLMLSAEFPVMLFLDERNRALEGVKQAVFQLTDSKAFYGKKLHPDTRIIVAENVGDSYQVEQCDPAEVSRCVTVTLEPTVEEWLKYASTICDQATIDFIRENGEKALENVGTFEPDKKYPDRRSWVKLDRELRNLGWFEDPSQGLSHSICCGFLGTEIGTKFYDYVRNRDRNVSAKDILTNWDKAAKKLRGSSPEVSNQAYIACCGKLGDYFEKNQKLSDTEVINLAQFLYDLPAEPRTNLWARINTVPPVLFAVHKHVKMFILAASTGGDLSGFARPELPKKATATAESESTTDDSDAEVGSASKTKRGAKRR